ncbi:MULTISPECIES: hypothetical protein [unclassified Nonomuraea]|uniref:hypothetical protein n=1 Tax=unclassified Nonomuraea TaxID=2593643 RepID=UPI001F27D3C0|nr:MULTISPECIES: hypothetical protein [unclassified Nonomuraea]
MVALVERDAGPPAGSLVEALKKVHDAFRREPALIRGEVAASGPRLERQRAQHVSVQRLLEQLQSVLASDDLAPEKLPAEANRLAEELGNETGFIAAAAAPLTQTLLK